MKAITFLVFLLISCTPEDDNYNCYYEGQHKQILELINKYRTNKLVCDFDATTLAEERVTEILTDFSHDKFRPVKGKDTGEILSFGVTTPEDVVNAFLSSIEHKELMLNEHYNGVGIGIINKHIVIILIK
jgi:uncharacterized protein YkwD